jgi:hypothetical protein
MSVPPDSMIDLITAKLAQEFPSFGGGKVDPHNFMSIALKDKRPMFAACVDIQLVVERVIREMREPTNTMIEAAVLSPGDGNLGVDATNTWQAMIDAALTSEMVADDIDAWERTST